MTRHLSLLSLTLLACDVRKPDVDFSCAEVTDTSLAEVDRASLHDDITAGLLVHEGVHDGVLKISQDSACLPDWRAQEGDWTLTLSREAARAIGPASGRSAAGRRRPPSPTIARSA